MGIRLQVRSRDEDISRGISYRSGVEVKIYEGVLAYRSGVEVKISEGILANRSGVEVKTSQWV